MSYDLVVFAKDHGSPQKAASLDVRVQVTDDTSEGEITDARSINIDIVENTPVGTIVGRASLYDHVSNSRVRYTEYAGNVFGLFVVNYTTGDIYLVKEINYEESSWHQIGIHAVDESKVFPQANTIRVDINVIDVNDNAPTFELNPVQINLPENLAPAKTVYMFTAVDMDKGLNLSLIHI